MYFPISDGDQGRSEFLARSSSENWWLIIGARGRVNGFVETYEKLLNRKLTLIYELHIIKGTRELIDR